MGVVFIVLLSARKFSERENNRTLTHSLPFPSCTILFRQSRARGMRSWERDAILARELIRTRTSLVEYSGCLWRFSATSYVTGSSVCAGGD